MPLNWDVDGSESVYVSPFCDVDSLHMEGRLDTLTWKVKQAIGKNVPILSRMKILVSLVYSNKNQGLRY